MGEAKSDEGADSNKAEISLLSSLGVGYTSGGDGERVRDDLVDLPLRGALSAEAEPNDLTSSCIMGGAGAGEEVMGAETSFMEPNLTARKRSWLLSLLKSAIETKRADANLLEIPMPTEG